METAVQDTETAAVETVTESDLLQMIKADPSRAEAEIRKLRDENSAKISNAKKDDYARLQEIAQKYEKEQEEKLKAKGEYEELLKQKDEKLKELDKQSEIVKRYSKHFEEQLETEMKELSPGLAEIVNNSTGDAAEKLALAKKLKSEIGIGQNSPASDRPTGLSLTGDITSIASNINAEKDVSKKAKMIFELKSKDDPFSKQVLGLIK